jgi:hypothetical protein
LPSQLQNQLPNQQQRQLQFHFINNKIRNQIKSLDQLIHLQFQSMETDVQLEHSGSFRTAMYSIFRDAIILQDIILNLLSVWVHSVCSVMIKLDVKALPRLWLYSGFRPAVKALADLSPEYVLRAAFSKCATLSKKIVSVCVCFW